MTAQDKSWYQHNFNFFQIHPNHLINFILCWIWICLSLLEANFCDVWYQFVDPNPLTKRYSFHTFARMHAIYAYLPSLFDPLKLCILDLTLPRMIRTGDTSTETWYSINIVQNSISMLVALHRHYFNSPKKINYLEFSLSLPPAPKHSHVIRNVIDMGWVYIRYA